jgi:hypothetical protein
MWPSANKFQSWIFKHTNPKAKRRPGNGAPTQVMEVRTSTADQTEQYCSYEGLCCLSGLEHVEGSANRCKIEVSELNPLPVSWNAPSSQVLRKWPLSYSFFKEAQSHFLPFLSGRSPVNRLSETGF